MKLGGMGSVKGAFELRSPCVVGWGHLTHDICDLGLEGQRTESHVIAEFIIPNKTDGQSPLSRKAYEPSRDES